MKRIINVSFQVIIDMDELTTPGREDADKRIFLPYYFECSPQEAVARWYEDCSMNELEFKVDHDEVQE